MLMECIYTELIQVTVQFISPSSFHTHTDGSKLTLQGAGFAIESNLEIEVLLKGYLTYGLEGPQPLKFMAQQDLLFSHSPHTT